MTHLSKILLLTLYSFFYCYTVYADEVFKWMDEKGIVHYSDKPLDQSNPDSSKLIDSQTGKSYRTDPQRADLSSFSEDQKLNHYYKLLLTLKNSLNNPDSFQLVKATALVNGNLCITYRGTNGFGGVITKDIELNWEGNETNEDNCYDSQGKDMTPVIFIRHLH